MSEYVMKIPNEFTILGHKIKVEIKEINKENNIYGYFSNAKMEIVIYKKVHSEGEDIILTNIQIYHTFWHEVFHVYQWLMKSEYNEQEAQLLAGFIMEFFQTSGIKIDPIHINEFYDD